MFYTTSTRVRRTGRREIIWGVLPTHRLQRDHIEFVKDAISLWSDVPAATNISLQPVSTSSSHLVAASIHVLEQTTPIDSTVRQVSQQITLINASH